MAEGTRWVDVTEGKDAINPKTNKKYSHVLNRNTEKKNDKEPDYRGVLHLAFSSELLGVINANEGKLKCNLSGWKRDGEYGPFLSLQLQHPIDAPVAEGAEGEGEADPFV